MFVAFFEPTPIKIMSDVVAVSTGGITMHGFVASHTMAIRSDGSLWTWGNNQRGQLGLGFASECREDRGIAKPTQIIFDFPYFCYPEEAYP